MFGRRTKSVDLAEGGGIWELAAAAHGWPEDVTAGRKEDFGSKMFHWTLERGALCTVSEFGAVSAVSSEGGAQVLTWGR